MNVMEIVQLVFAYNLNNNPRVMGLLNCVIRNPADQEKVAMLNRIISYCAVRKQLSGNPFRDAVESVCGEIKIAMTDQGIPVGMNFREEPHLLIAGQTGSGKSVLLHLILGQFL